MKDLSNVEHMPDDALVSVSTVAKLIEQSNSSVWRRLDKPDFLKRIRLGKRCTRVRLGDVRKWLHNQVEAAQ